MPNGVCRYAQLATDLMSEKAHPYIVRVKAYGDTDYGYKRNGFRVPSVEDAHPYAAFAIHQSVCAITISGSGSIMASAQHLRKTRRIMAYYPLYRVVLNSRRSGLPLQGFLVPVRIGWVIRVGIRIVHRLGLGTVSSRSPGS